MHVAIDGLPQSQGGGVTYLRYIVPALLDTSNIDSVTLFTSEDIASEFEQSADQNLTIEEINVPNIFSRLLYEQLLLPVELYRRDIDVLFASADIAPLAAPCRVVLANHNSNLYYDRGSRNFSDTLRYFFLQVLFVISGIRAASIIFVSKTAKKRACNTLPISKKKSVAIHYGVDSEMFRPEAIDAKTRKLAPDENFLLFVSTLYSHKNVESLLQAYSKIRPELRDEYELYIVGGDDADERYASNLKQATERLGLQNKVHFKGQVPFEVLPAFYNRATVFVFPSILESFGFPVLEAMAAETPVLASSAAAIPEIVGDGGRYFDPHDPDQLAVLLEQTLESDSNEQLIQRGKERVRMFTWENCAAKTASVLTQE